MITVMIYRLETAISVFELRQEPLGMWDLWVDGTPTLTFTSPEEAAQAVCDKQSGYSVWDNDDTQAPADLPHWKQVEE